jgi:uncharacterized protein
MKRPAAVLAALSSGIVFGIGLSIARMTDPQKIKDFLDIAAIPSGGWDPSLAFVMAGGLAVAAIGLRLDRVLRRPVAAPLFVQPIVGLIDRPLIAGSVLFGVGWGLAGLCPGPAIVDLGLAGGGIIVLVLAMLAGSWAAGGVLSRLAARNPVTVPAE